MTTDRWQQAMALLEEALDYSTAKRLAFVQIACGGDDELRREVESLLHSRDQGGAHFLTTGALEREVAKMLAHAPRDLSGQSIKQFTLLERLGGGGMGEVYLAHDRQLDRKVALKLLPARAMADDTRLRRFAREARAASALNHPNILQVYEIGHADGWHYIATEYVAGQTLRARLQAAAEKPLPLDETWAVSTQVASALVAAHAAGIIHRDIKPENLMLRPDGVVKVLDFGIAKLTERWEGGETERQRSGQNQNLIVSQSLSSPVSPASHLSVYTEAGMVLGTPGYMSPEQARAQAVTESTDLFSLGVILYEMLTGQLPFQGATKADFIARLLTADPPDLRKMRPDLPRAYATVLQRLLAKDLTARYVTATEAKAALTQLPHTAPSQWRRIATTWMSGRRPAYAAALLFVCLAAFFAVRFFQQRRTAAEPWSDPAKLKRRQIYSTKIGRDLSSSVFSPDGQWIAFDMADEKAAHLYVLPRLGGSAKQLTSDESNDRNPLWSPDSQRLAFFSERRNGYGIWVLPSVGGEPKLLKKLDSIAVELVAWRRNEAGEKLYYTADSDLYALNVTDGETYKLCDLPNDPASVSAFSLSPDGMRLLYREVKDNTYLIHLRSLDDGQNSVLLSAKTPIYSPQWFPDGEGIAYCTSESGVTQPNVMFLADKRATPLNFGADDFAGVTVAPEGTAVLGRSQNEISNIYQIDLHGKEKTLTSEIGQQHLPMLSPDGRQLVYRATGGLLRREEVLLTKSLINPADETQKLASNIGTAQWSPDGQWLAMARFSSPQYDLFIVKADGTEESLLATSLWPPRFRPMPFYLLSHDFTWAPDGQRIVYVSRVNQRPGLMQVEIEGRAIKPLLSPTQDETAYFYSPSFSPDGRYLFFTKSTNNLGNRLRQAVVLEAGNQRVLRETSQSLLYLGWLSDGDSLLVAEGPEESKNEAQNARVLQCAISSAHCQRLTQLENIYLPSLQLSPDKRALAYVTRRDGWNNIAVLSLATGQRRQLTHNTDAGLYYAGLRWTPDGLGLLFSKQTSYEILTLIEPR